VFLRVYECLDGLRDDAAIRPWVGQLTRRVCVDQLRRRRRESDEELPELGSLDIRLERIEEAGAVQDALASLSPDCCEILDRFFCRDESYAQISRELGLPAGTIASRISRCLARLRSEVDARA
jgi:RNA polymerase sigma-70 factor (ECF subfamily)